MKKCLLYIVISTALWLGLGGASLSAQTDLFNICKDTLSVRIADSSYIEDPNTGQGAIRFFLEINRPVNVWQYKMSLGDIDFYFWFNRKAFHQDLPPGLNLDGVIPEVKLDPAIISSSNMLLKISAEYHADRLLIAIRNTGKPGGDEFDISNNAIFLNKWVRICEVTVPMNEPARRPEIDWDRVATGALNVQSQRIALKMSGNVKENPNSTISAEEQLAVEPVIACAGGNVKVYIKDLDASGNLRFAWSDSIVGGALTPVRNNPLDPGEDFLGSESGTNARFSYQTLGRGDTLLILNAPENLDQMYVQCQIKNGTNDVIADGTLRVRDSIHAWLGKTFDAPYGMSGKTDTVKKCPASPAALKLFFYGPSYDEMGDPAWIGSKLKVTVSFFDPAIVNLEDSTYTVDLSGFPNNVNYIAADDPDNKTGREVFVYDLGANISNQLAYIKSIQTDFCANGVSYAPYDTVYIREVEAPDDVMLADITVPTGGSVSGELGINVPFPFESITFKNGIAMTSTLGMIQKKGTSYTYKSNVKNLVGTDTIYYNMTKEGCKMQVMRQIRVTKLFYASIKVLLEGPYVGKDAHGKDSMRCEFIQFDMFPKNNIQAYMSPYDSVALTKDVKAINIGGTICDWVQILLRDGEEGAYVDSVSAFLRQDGIICDTSGTPFLIFKNLKNQNYQIVVRHRNHLNIMSKPYVLTDIQPTINNILIDLTKSGNVFDKTPSDNNYPLVDLLNSGGLKGMLAGDGNGDGLITRGDRSSGIVVMGQLGYITYDFDSSMVVEARDLSRIIFNLGAVVDFIE